MTEQRFVAEQVDVMNEDETEVWDIVFDTDKTYAFMVRDMGTANELCGLLNEQQATIEMYQRRVHKREEQISIIKKHCLKFLTDEQIEIIRKELENE